MIQKNLTIHVPNTSVMCLYTMEMEGQISDGKYENSRPFDHWKWVCNVKDIVVDGSMGISGETWYHFGYTNKTYNINEWVTYINGYRKGNKKYENYDWATRVIAYAKFGLIYPNITYKELMNLGEVRIFLENLQSAIEAGETNPEVLFNDITDWKTYSWREKYYEKCKDYITLEFVKKFLETNYDVKELKEDLKNLANSVNTEIK